MNIVLRRARPTLADARRLWANEMVPRHTQAHNMRAWRASIRQLGDRWLLAAPQPRRDGGRP